MVNFGRRFTLKSSFRKNSDSPANFYEDIKAAIIRTGEPLPTGSHPFNTICAKHGIEHRLIKPRHPHKFAGSKFGPLEASPKGEPQGKGEQTNGMIERFKGRIQEVLAHRPLRLIPKPGRYVDTRYPVIIQPLDPASRARPYLANPGLAKLAQKRPELFNKCVYNQAGFDIFPKLETL